jgi:hypothetical protein
MVGRLKWVKVKFSGMGNGLKWPFEFYGDPNGARYGIWFNLDQFQGTKWAVSEKEFKPPNLQSTFKIVIGYLNFMLKV